MSELSKAKSGQIALSDNMLFEDWNRYWFSIIKYRLRITSQKRYEETINSIISPAFDGRCISEISEYDAQNFFNGLRADGISSARQTYILSIARQSLDYAVNRKLIDYNPFALVQLPRKVHKKTAILYDDDIKQMLEKYSEHPLMPLYMVILLCGMRIGEALGLTWDKVNFDAGTLEISQQLIRYDEDGHTVYRLVSYTKNGQSRTICLPSVAAEWLKKQQNMSQSASAGMGNLIFTMPDGSWIKYAHARYHFDKIMKDIGREDVTLHSLRHTAAATVLYTTGDIAAQQRFLGHRGTGSTIKYGDATMKAQRRFAAAIDNAFKDLFGEKGVEY